MTNDQLYLALGLPVILNALMFLGINSRITDLKDMFRAELGKAVAELRAEMWNWKRESIGGSWG